MFPELSPDRPERSPRVTSGITVTIDGVYPMNHRDIWHPSDGVDIDNLRLDDVYDIVREARKRSHSAADFIDDWCLDRELSITFTVPV